MLLICIRLVIRLDKINQTISKAKALLIDIFYPLIDKNYITGAPNKQFARKGTEG